MKKTTLNDETSLFHEQMSGVKPLKKRKTIAPNPIKVIQATAKTIIEDNNNHPYQDNLDKRLNSLQKKQQAPIITKPGISINCDPQYDLKITSDTILEWQLDTLSTSHQQKLRQGDFAIQNRIDLHGLDRFEAEERLKRFIEHAKSHGKRNLLVIHGKGSRHGETPILKQHLFIWLKNYPYVLALQSAHAKHGGSGALYVLLKKHLNKIVI